MKKKIIFWCFFVLLIFFTIITIFFLHNVYNNPPDPIFSFYDKSDDVYIKIICEGNNETKTYIISDPKQINEFIDGILSIDLSINWWGSWRYSGDYTDYLDDKHGYSYISVIIYDKNDQYVDKVDIWGPIICSNDAGIATYKQKDNTLTKFIVTFCENKKLSSE